MKKGLDLALHCHAKCLQIVLVPLVGDVGRMSAVRMGCCTISVDLCMTHHPYGVAHGPPLINKWKDHPGGQESSAGPFATAMPWLTGIQNGHPPRLPVRRLLTLSLVMSRRAEEGWWRGLGGDTQKRAWVPPTFLPKCWLVWVTKWCGESTQTFIINLSGSNRIPSILAPQSFCPPSCSPPLEGSPCLCGDSGNVRRGVQSSGIVQLLLFNYASFSSQLKDRDIIIT